MTKVIKGTGYVFPHLIQATQTAFTQVSVHTHTGVPPHLIQATQTAFTQVSVHTHTGVPPTRRVLMRF